MSGSYPLGPELDRHSDITEQDSGSLLVLESKTLMEEVICR